MKLSCSRRTSVGGLPALFDKVGTCGETSIDMEVFFEEWQHSLGMEFARSKSGILVNQRKYILNLLKETS